MLHLETIYYGMIYYVHISVCMCMVASAGAPAPDSRGEASRRQNPWAENPGGIVSISDIERATWACAHRPLRPKFQTLQDSPYIYIYIYIYTPI